MRRFLCLLILTGALVLPGVAGMAQGTPQYRAFWADAFHNGFKSAGQVDTLVADLLAHNCNMVVVQMRRRGDTYYPSPFEGGVIEDTSYDPDFDALAYLIKKCHSATPRIEVHAWLCTLPIWNSQTPPSTTTRPEHPYNLYPQFLTKTSTGTTWDGSNYVFDPGHPDCLKYEADVYMDVVNRYDVDGVHYDYIRFASASYGYNDTSVSRYNTWRTDGFPADFSRWRRNQISALARQIYGRTLAAEAARRGWGYRPVADLSGSTITWGNGPGTNDDAWYSTSAYTSVMQNWREWMEEGILDINIPMTYYNYSYVNPTTGARYSDYYNNWIEYEKNHKYNRHLAIGPGVYLNSVPDSFTEIYNGNQPSTRGHNTDGFCFYSYAVPSGPSGTPADPVRFKKMLVDPGTPPDPVPNPDNGGNPPFATKVGIPAQPWRTAPTSAYLMGCVTEQSGGNSIAADMAVVSISGPVSGSMRVDGNGFYCFISVPVRINVDDEPTSFVDLPAGTYTITVTKTGFAPVSRTVTITNGINPFQNFHLGGTDSTAPTISGTAARNVTDSKANITWNTNEPADSRVEYGLTTSYGMTTVVDQMLSGSRTGYLNAALGHCVPLCLLSPGTTYHYRVISRDSSGNETVSGDYTFTTSGTDMTGPAILNPTVANLTGSSATVTWNTHELADSQVEYGLDVLYSSSSTLDPTMVMSHSVNITGLSPNTTYHFRIKSADSAGNTSYSHDMTFTTTTGGPPVITGGPAATNIQPTSTTITWTTDVISDSQVEYDTDGAPYANQTTLDPTMVTSHSVNLTGLTPGTLYHYRVRSANAGGTTYSTDFTFTTAAPDTDPPVFGGLTSAEDAYVDARSIKLSWTAATDATGPITYLIYMSTTPGGQNFSSPTATTTQTSYIVNGLNTAETCYFVVRARDSAVPPNTDSNTIERSASAWNLVAESRVTGKNYSAYTENSGPWADSTAKSAAVGCSASSTGSRYAAPLYTGGTINRFTFQPNIQTAGLYRTYVTWGYYGPNCRNGKFALTYDSGGSKVTYLDLVGTGTGQNYNQWLEVTAGPTPFASGTGGKLVGDDSENTGTVHTGNTGRFYADAVRFEYIGPAIAAPTSLTATAGQTSVALSWPSVSGAAGYKVYRSTMAGSFGDALADAAGTSYTDHAVVNGTTYYYVVRAVDSSGYVGFASPSATGTPDSTPPIISNIQANPIGITTATITWTTDEASDSQVEYGLSAGPPYTYTTTLNPSLVANHSAALSGLQAGTLYHYRVRSADGLANVAWSGDNTFTTSTPVGTYFLIESRSGGLNKAWNTDTNLSNYTQKSTAVGCTAGIGSRAQTTNNKTGTATFQPQLAAATFPADGYYNILATWGSSSAIRCYNTRATITYDSTWGGTGTQTVYFDQNGPTNGNTWVSLAGPLPFSGNNDKVVLDDQVNTTNSSSYRFVSDAVKFQYWSPLAPTGVTISDVQRYQVTLNWTNPTFDFGSVRIYRSTSPGDLGFQVATNVTGTTWTDTGLTPETTYYYTVRSVSAALTLAESPNTNQVSATTLAAPETFTSPLNFVRSGWNLVSLPAVPVNSDPLVVLDEIDVPNSSLQYWQNDVDGGGYQNYGQLFGWTGPLVCGVPYWFLENTQKTIFFDGDANTTDFTINIPAHNSAPYWIMLGQPFNHNTWCADIKFNDLNWVDAYSAGIVESTAQCFKNGSFISTGPPAFMVEYDRFEPWYGYWLMIRVTTPVTVTIPVSPVAP